MFRASRKNISEEVQAVVSSLNQAPKVVPKELETLKQRVGWPEADEGFKLDTRRAVGRALKTANVLSHNERADVKKLLQTALPVAPEVERRHRQKKEDRAAMAQLKVALEKLEQMPQQVSAQIEQGVSQRIAAMQSSVSQQVSDELDRRLGPLQADLQTAFSKLQADMTTWQAQKAALQPVPGGIVCIEVDGMRFKFPRAVIDEYDSIFKSVFSHGMGDVDEEGVFRPRHLPITVDDMKYIQLFYDGALPSTFNAIDGAKLCNIAERVELKAMKEYVQERTAEKGPGLEAFNNAVQLLCSKFPDVPHHWELRWVTSGEPKPRGAEPMNKNQYTTYNGREELFKVPVYDDSSHADGRLA